MVAHTALLNCTSLHTLQYVDRKTPQTEGKREGFNYIPLGNMIEKWVAYLALMEKFSILFMNVCVSKLLVKAFTLNWKIVGSNLWYRHDSTEVTLVYLSQYHVIDLFRRLACSLHKRCVCLLACSSRCNM